MPAASAAREQEVREIGARDQQQDAHGAEQREQRRARLARDLLLQRRHGALVAAAAHEIVVGQSRRDRRQLRLRLRKRDAGLEPRDAKPANTPRSASSCG